MVKKIAAPATIPTTMTTNISQKCGQKCEGCTSESCRADISVTPADAAETSGPVERGRVGVMLMAHPFLLFLRDSMRRAARARTEEFDPIQAIERAHQRA